MTMPLDDYLKHFSVQRWVPRSAVDAVSAPDLVSATVAVVAAVESPVKKLDVSARLADALQKKSAAPIEPVPAEIIETPKAEPAVPSPDLLPPCGLMLYHCGDSAWLFEQSHAFHQGLSPDEEQLARNILAAVKCQPVQAPEHFNWPLSDKTCALDEMQQAINGFVSRKPFKQLLVFGLPALQMENAVQLPSLQTLLIEPAGKRAVWQALQQVFRDTLED